MFINHNEDYKVYTLNKKFLVNRSLKKKSIIVKQIRSK